MVKRKLFLSVWRDITRNRAQFLGLVVMIGLGAGSLGLFLPSYYNLSNTYDYTYDRLNLADFRVQTVLQTESVSVTDIGDIMAELAKNYPIEYYENRIVHELTMLKNQSGTLSLIAIRLIGINVTDGRHPLVNDVSVVDGRWFEDSDNWNQNNSFNEYTVLIDSRLASYHDIESNDRMDLLVSGNINQTTEARVIGSVGTAEYLFLTASWQDIMPSSRRFGVAYVPLSSLQHMIGFNENEVNDICVTMEPGTSEETRENAMEALERSLLAQGHSVLPPIPKNQEPSFAALQFDLEGMAEMVVVFPIFILLLAIFSTYVMVSRLVAAQRQQAGVTLALGYSRGDIYRKYLSYGAVVAIMGSLVGIIIGELTSRWFTDIYLGMMQAPFRVYGFYPEVMVINIIVSVAVCMLGCALPARSLSKMIPAASMRDDPGEMVAGRTTLLEKIYNRITGSWLRIRWKIVLRNLFRNRRRTLSTLVGITMSFILVCSTAGADDSFQATMDAMAVREGWDIQVQYTDFKMSDVLQDDLEKIDSWPNVDKAYSGITFSTILSSPQRNLESSLQVRIQDPMDSIHNFEFKTPGGAFNDTGIVITQGTADDLQVNMGGNITILHPRINITSVFPLQYSFKMVNSSVRVTGITDETTSLVCWVSLSLAQELIGQDVLDANTIYIKLNGATQQNIESTKQRIIREIAGIRSAISAAERATDMEEYLEFLRLFLYVLIGFSITLAGSIVMTTSVINVLERKLEIATVLTLGAPFSFSQKTFQSENLAITITGVLLGIPLSYLALEELAAAFSTDFFTFVIRIESLTILLSAIAILIAALVVQWYFVRGFSDMDLAQETKRKMEG